MMTSKTMMVPIDVNEDGTLSVPPESVELLDGEQSQKAHNTRLHSLRMLENLAISGALKPADMIKVLETLAKFQFKPASMEPNKKKGPATAEDMLKELLKDE
jgi:hypothetical protein